LSALLQNISTDNVEKVVLRPGDSSLRGEFKDNSEPARTYGTRHFAAAYDPATSDGLQDLLREHSVTFEFEQQTLGQALFNPQLLALAIVLMFVAAAHGVFIKAVVRTALAEAEARALARQPA
jgi:hypothetical protein